MTTKLFWQDPYQTRLQTHIKSVNGAWVELEETIFYAFSGGQESDKGTIGSVPVLEACKQDMSIEYRLNENHGLHAGQAVLIEIDGARRLALMRHHFAAELVLELVCRNFPEFAKIGAHIGADKARIDFASEQNIKALLPELQQQAQQLIDQDLPITSAFSDAVAQRRYWQIDGFAQVPCGGTHVKSTAEIGQISLKRKNIGKGKERIEIMAAT